MKSKNPPVRDLLASRPGLTSRIFLQLYDWLPNNRKAEEETQPEDSESAAWLLKACVAIAFLWVPRGYQKLMTILTRYYPFSLLYQDRWFHADNLPRKRLMEKLEKTAARCGLPLLILSGEDGTQYMKFEGMMIRRVAKRAQKVKSFEAALEKKSITGYVRILGSRVRIVIVRQE